MNLKKIYKEVADELGIEESTVEDAYLSLWRFFRSNIELLPLKNIKSEEEFNKLRMNCNISHIGKLYSTWGKYKGVAKKFNIIMKYKKDHEQN